MSVRDNFSNKFGFIAAAAGTAVGLGNIWRFPFEVSSGGGAAFLLIYLGFCFLICLPLMVTEIAIGRKAQKDVSGAFAALGFKKWTFIGKMGILSCVLGLSMYLVVAAWALGYVFEMLSGDFEIGNQFGSYVMDVKKVGAYGVAFMLMTAAIVSGGISGGIEKASKLLLPTLLILILVLGGYALTLPHALKGIGFYLVPDFSEVRLPVISGALGQAFFSLSIGIGAHITYGSYVSKKDNILSSASWITGVDVVVAFLCGLMIFPIIAFISQGTFENVSSGPGLIFETLPGVFGSLGSVTGRLVGILFFLLLSFAALTTAIAMLEVPVSYLVDEHQINRKTAVMGMTAFILLLSIPSVFSNGYSAFLTHFITYGSRNEPTNFLTFVLHLNDLIVISSGILIAVFAGFVWKQVNLNAEISIGFPAFQHTRIGGVMQVLLRYVCPVVLGIILVLTILDRYVGVTVI